MRLVEGRGLPERFDWQQRLVSTVTRCRPAPPSARCTLWPRHWTRTERREDSLWTGSSNMKTPTWPHPPCKTQTHTGVTHRCVCMVMWPQCSMCVSVWRTSPTRRSWGSWCPTESKSSWWCPVEGTATHTHSADITSCPLQLTVSCSCHQWSLEVFLSSRRHSVKRLRPSCTWTFPTQRSDVCPRLHGNATRVKRVSGSYLT